ncbi:MAG: hypothetical protein GY856_40820 [bacterium]|nr:hypothetical protein [bacterium]
MPETISTVEQYLERLREELAGSDPAVIQDALYDAEEHLRTEHAALAAGGEAGGESALLEQVIEKYGTPREVAEAYCSTEAKVATALAQPVLAQKRTALERVFDVVIDPRAYSSLFYMFLAMGTGIVYFTWVVTGLSMSLGFSILIFGIPFFLLFLATVRVISLVEGRIVETLLGVRMPRRPVFGKAEGNWWERIKFWLSDMRTWSTMLYMALQLPLGTIYFTVFVFLLTLSLALFAAPFAQIFFDQPMISIWETRYYLPLWAMPLVWLASLFDLLVTLHLARLTGRLHGSIAKAMLVRD